jgi:hypothetical protein
LFQVLKSFHTVHRVLLTGTPLQVRRKYALLPTHTWRADAGRDIGNNYICNEQHMRASARGAQLV